MLPITWNQDTSRWEVKDLNGTVLWSGINYADAAQFAEDYANRQKAAAQNLSRIIQVASARD